MLITLLLSLLLNLRFNQNNMCCFFSPRQNSFCQVSFFFSFYLFFHVFSFLSSCLSLCGIQQFQCPVVSPHCFSPGTPVWTLNCRLAGINTWMSWLQLFSFSFPSSYFFWNFHRISVKSFPLVTIGPPLLDSDIMNCHGHWINVIIKVVAEFLYRLSQSWYYKYIFLLLSMTSMLWEIPNMTESDLSSSCFFSWAVLLVTGVSLGTVTVTDAKCRAAGRLWPLPALGTQAAN